MTIQIPDELFHGSLALAISQFRGYPHFGSVEAARAAAAAKYYDQPDPAVSGALYIVKLNLQPNEWLHMDDWGSPGPIPLLREMANSVAFGDLEEAAQNAVVLKGKGRRFGPGPSCEDALSNAELFANEEIRKALAGSPIKAIVYGNKVEAPGSVGVCVVTPISGCISIKRIQALSPQDLVEAWDSIDEDRKRTLQFSAPGHMPRKW